MLTDHRPRLGDSLLVHLFQENQSTLDPLRLARPHLHQHAREIQPFGSLVRLPIALDEKIRTESVALLNQLLADTMTLRDLVSDALRTHEKQV